MISQRLNCKKNLTEIKEFFETYFKIITPLLVDCWLEAKPENKRILLILICNSFCSLLKMFKILEIIDNYESLNIMNSVLSILNLLLENLNFNFGDLASQLRVTIFEFSCVI